MNVDKQYSKAFVLESTKLVRIVEIIHDRLADHPGTTREDKFEVFLVGNRREVRTKVEDVLTLDNSRRSRVTRLIITCSAGSTGVPRPSHEVRIDFGAPKPSANNQTAEVIELSVSSHDPGWASRTLSEIEEQLERTFLGDTWAIGTLVAVLVAGILLLASQFVSPHPDAKVENLWLTKDDMKRVREILVPEHSITNDEFREILTMQLRNVVDASPPVSAEPSREKRPRLALVISLAAIVLCTCTLLAIGYPRRVYSWGDGVARYEKSLQVRRLLWGIIMSVGVVSILAALFREGLSPWLPH